MNPNSTRRWTATLLALGLPVALAAQGSSDRIQRLRERLLERGRDPTPPVSPLQSPERLESPESLEHEAVSPGQKVDSEDLEEAERSSMKTVAAQVLDDAELLSKGGFRLVSDDEPRTLAYPAEPDEAEYVLEVQSQLKIPGAKAPVPHRRLLVVKASRTVGPEGRLAWTFHVEAARESKVVSEDGKPQLVLDSDEDLQGAVVPLDTDLQGVPSRTDQTVTQARYVDWLRLLLPSRPKRPGYGWRTLSPRSLGGRLEALGGIYLYHRRVELGEGREVAVIRGRFQGRGLQQGESQFMSLGQDRVLFDLDRGRVLYREFRMEGSYLRNTPQGPQPYQARIKGLVMERSLLEGLSAEDRKARLNAATALFGQ